VALPPSHRLKSHQDFRAVYERGQRYGSERLTLKVLPLPYRAELPSGKPPTQFGIAIGQKVSKKAVVRNRLKRQLKAAFRELLEKVKPGFWAVAIAKPQAVGCKYEHFLRELEELLHRAGIIHGD
jgi:ribonuclease P protein component